MLEAKRFLKFISFTALGIGGMAFISIFCDHDLVRRGILTQFQNTFDDLIHHSNERDDVQRLLKKIPDGYERDVAELINGAIDTFSGRRRSLQRKQSGKPHHAIYTAIKAAANIYTRR